MNVFYSMWSLEDVLLSKRLLLLWDFLNRRIIALFEGSVLEEDRILHYLYNNSAVLTPKFQNKATTYTWENFRSWLMTTFFTFYFLTVPLFSL